MEFSSFDRITLADLKLASPTSQLMRISWTATICLLG